MNRDLKLVVPMALNYQIRLFGYPAGEFFLLMLVAVILLDRSILLFSIFSIFVYVTGKIRRKKPVDWFTYLPYLWMKINYPYLIKPGRKTYLP